MRVEEEYMDVLQNIEAEIVYTYRQNRELSDYEVMRALEALVDAYSGEQIGRPPRNFNLSKLEREVMEKMRAACEWRLGRSGPPTEDEMDEEVNGPAPKTVDEIILCLKRLEKSAKMWTKEAGRQGYLEFIAEYIR